MTPAWEQIFWQLWIQRSWAEGVVTGGLLGFFHGLTIKNSKNGDSRTKDRDIIGDILGWYLVKPVFLLAVLPAFIGDIESDTIVFLTGEHYVPIIPSDDMY